MQLEQPSQRRGARLPRPRLRRGEAGPPLAGIDPLLKKIRTYNPKADLKELRAGVSTSPRSAHEGQKRLSGEDFIEHPLAVAGILADLHLDTTTLDGGATARHRRGHRGHARRYRRRVRRRGRPDRRRAHEARQVPSSRRASSAGRERPQDDRGDGGRHPRAADQARRPAPQHAHARQPRAREAAARSPPRPSRSTRPSRTASACRRSSGSSRTCPSRPCTPGPYREIANLVETRRGERQRLIQEVTDSLRTKLKELGIKADVEGRPKHLYSIYEKMVIRGKEFNEIFDLVGIRIQVESLRDMLRRPRGRPRPVEADPRAASRTTSRCPSRTCTSRCTRRSLGPEGKPLEIQIRTRDMHRTAQFGIAAHWRYKEREAGA